MKKQTLIAVIGTFALVANVLLPGLAFGQATDTQTGTATITCSTTAPTFADTPANNINFYGDGSSSSVYPDGQAFNNPAGSLDASANADYIAITDVRDPEIPGCNNGLTLAVTVQDNSGDSDSIYFDANPTGSGGDFIELEDFMVVSSSDTCAASATEINAVGICFDNTALCGEGDNTAAATCTDEGSTTVDYTGTAFATWATFTGNGATLGTTNTPAPTTLMSFADINELYGTAGLATSYGINIDAFDTPGTYVVEILYTLTAL